MRTYRRLKEEEHGHFRMCTECGPIPPERKTFTCDICNYGDFDLCEKCIAKGAHCWGTRHTLEEIVDDCEEINI